MENASKIFDIYSAWAFKKKSYSKAKAHQALYFPLRKKFPQVPSALIQSIRDTCLESIKATKFKVKPKSRPYRSLRLDKRLITLRGRKATIRGHHGRIKLDLEIPKPFEKVFKTWEFKQATVVYRKHSKEFYLRLCMFKESPEKKDGKVAGIDRGIYNLATLSDGKNFSNSEVRANQRKWLYLRKKLQAKGTPSSKRLLKKLSGKERRFSRDVNHCITKKLVSLPYGTFVLENLSGIRKRNRGRKMNKFLGSWPLFQFQTFLEYKAEAVGKSVKYIDPRYTSQRCSKCGHISRHSRKRSRFHCVLCGHQEHADSNAAKNIKHIFLTHEELREQGPVNDPHATIPQESVASLTPCGGGS
jgi:IS605 OrfB family transposase